MNVYNNVSTCMHTGSFPNAIICLLVHSNGTKTEADEAREHGEYFV